ncbi:MAG: hypothetical protein HOQ24_03965 [Mycobacteriaceae bacterium]|nr:hypothetical protein [Mycobacteriaceae bacterium]
MRRCLVVAIAALLALAACGHDDSAAPTSTTAPMTEPAAPPTAPTETETVRIGAVVQRDPGIVDPRPIPFASWSRAAPDRIAVHFEMGSPQCYGVDATVTETAAAVTVALRTGAKPAAVGRVCPMIAVLATLELPLKSALNPRTVIQKDQ